MSDGQIIPADQILPDRLFVIPITGKPIFPGILSPLVIGDSEGIEIVEKALSATGMIGLTLTLKVDVEKPGADQLYTIGTVVKVVKKINLPDGGINVFITALKRFRIMKFLTKKSPISAAVNYLDETNVEGDEVKALTRALLAGMKQVSQDNPLFSEQMRLDMVNIDQPGKIADFIASILNIDREQQQKVLETTNVRERMEQVLVFIMREQELRRIQEKIQQQISEKIEKSQREYFLKEQLKAIRDELGMPVDAKSSEYQRF